VRVAAGSGSGESCLLTNESPFVFPIVSPPSSNSLIVLGNDPGPNPRLRSGVSLENACSSWTPNLSSLAEELDSGRLVIGRPRATVYLFRGVGLGLVSRANGGWGAGSPCEGGDSKLLVVPDETLGRGDPLRGRPEMIPARPEKEVTELLRDRLGLTGSAAV